MTSPYQGLGPSAFWRSAVAEGDPGQDPALYVPRAAITPKTRIFTAGSCFAQHVTRALRAANCNVIDTEPMDLPLAEAVKQRFGYGLYSARFGNIYTLRQFRQLVEETMGLRRPAAAIWTRDGAYFDALRPSVEPEGFGSEVALRDSRGAHLAAVKSALGQTDLLVFTLGLTECWEHIETGTVYPTAPETLAGQFDPEIFGFRNLGYDDCIEDFVALRGHLAVLNPDLKFLLTVSPVPLTATASGAHVLQASSYSKAVLRAVCGALYQADQAVDYFPSYELITTPRRTGHWFDTNLRTPTPEGVAMVMDHFLRAHGIARAAEAPTQGGDEAEPPDDPLCDEILLEAFAK